MALLHILFNPVLSFLKRALPLLLSCFMSFSSAQGTEAETPALTLVSINVGKADCHLLLSGNSAYMVDVGRGKTWDTVESVLNELGITRLNGVILTHTHSDHAGGLKKMLKSGIQIDHIYTSAFYSPEEEGDENPVLKSLRKSDLEAEYLKSGDTLPLDGGTLQVLGPITQHPAKENNNSVVLLASAGASSVLLTGDMEFPEERDLLAANLLPRVDVLKIGNHGEGDATSDAFIAAVAPKLAVIPTNTEEEPDTPDPRVIRLLESWKVRILQTQESARYIRITLRNGEIETEMK